MRFEVSVVVEQQFSLAVEAEDAFQAQAKAYEMLATEKPQKSTITTEVNQGVR